MKHSVVPWDAASKQPNAGISSPAANTWILSRPPLISSMILPRCWAEPCKTSSAGVHVVDIRHWNFGWAMTLGASTAAVAPATTSSPPAFTMNLRRTIPILQSKWERSLFPNTLENSTLASPHGRENLDVVSSAGYNSTDTSICGFEFPTSQRGGIELHFTDARLSSVWDKVQAGRRLSREDGLLLFETDDLLGLGRMADHAKSAREGDRVYFVLNRYISPTNVCVLSCSFCGFARKKGEAGAFEYTVEDIVGMVSEEVREVHIVGGHHPEWPFEYYERIIASLHAARPHVQIKAFTAAEIDYFWRRCKIEPQEALARLKAAGLQTMPGGGAEIFSARVARLLRYTGKADPERWCEIHGIAHSLGIKTNATMLYGHIETFAERVDHLLRLGAAGRLGRVPHVHSPPLPGRDDARRASANAPHRQAPHHRRGTPAPGQLPARRGVLGAPRRGDGVGRAPLRRRRRQRHARGRARAAHGGGPDAGRSRARATLPHDQGRRQGPGRARRPLQRAPGMVVRAAARDEASL